MNNRMCDIMYLTDEERALDECYAVWRAGKERPCRFFDCGRFDYEPSEEAYTDEVAVGRYEVEFLAQAAVKALRLAHKAGMVRGREFVDTLDQIRTIDDMIAMQPSLDDIDDFTDKPVIL